MSTTRTVGKAALLLALVVPAMACSDDDDGSTSTTVPSSTTTTAGAAAELPDDVEPGTGVLVLAGERQDLTVTSCSQAPIQDETTGVITEFAVDTAFGDGGVMSATRATFAGDVTTTTDTVTVVSPTLGALEASRADAGGNVIDLRDPAAVERLFGIDVDIVGAGRRLAADAIFGPLGGTDDDPANVPGAFVLRCP